MTWTHLLWFLGGIAFGIFLRWLSDRHYERRTWAGTSVKRAPVGWTHEPAQGAVKNPKPTTAQAQAEATGGFSDSAKRNLHGK